MDDLTLLNQVKIHLGIETEDELINDNIRIKVMAVKNYLIKAGAKQMITDPITKKSNINEIDVECIAIGVNDLLNSRAGETKFSPAFNLFALQICRG